MSISQVAMLVTRVMVFRYHNSFAIQFEEQNKTSVKQLLLTSASRFSSDAL